MNNEQKLELIHRWVEALRSKKYKQGHDHLRFKDKFCCLSVLCDIYDPSLWNYNSTFWNSAWEIISHNELESIFDFLNIPQSTLWDLNDGIHTFEEIADFIEENIEIQFENLNK